MLAQACEAAKSEMCAAPAGREGGGEAVTAAHAAEEEPGDEELPDVGIGGGGSGCGRATPNSSNEEVREELGEGEEDAELQTSDVELTFDSSCRSSRKSEDEEDSGIHSGDGDRTRVGAETSAEAPRRDDGAGTSQLPAGASLQTSGTAAVFDCATASHSSPGAAGLLPVPMAGAHAGGSHVAVSVAVEPGQEQQGSPGQAQQGSLEHAHSPAVAPAGGLHASPGAVLGEEQQQQQLQAHHWPSRLDPPKLSMGRQASGVPAAVAAVSPGQPAAGGHGAATASAAADPGARPAGAAPAAQPMPPPGYIGGAGHAARPAKKPGRPPKAHTAKSRLKDAFLSIYKGLRKSLPDAVVTPFLEQVNQLYVADYNDWVKVEDEVWLERIRKNISAGQYSTRTALLADVQRLLTNATCYNNPGHGLHGDQGIIELAQQIVTWVSQEVETRRDELTTLEQAAALEPMTAAASPAVAPKKPPPARSGAPPKPLPPGFTFRIVKSPAKPRGYGEYMADCPVHGRSERRMDRWDHVAKFFEGHAGCRADWADWAQAEGEEREAYINRLRDTFHFRRNDTPASLVTEVFSLGHASKGLARPATQDSKGAADVVFQGQGRVWLAAPDSQIRQAMLPRIQEKVADMQRVTPAKAFPSAASIEEVLYQNASTDLEYAKPGNLGLRITRAISDIERRTGKGTARSPQPGSPSAADRSFAPNCDRLLDAAGLVQGVADARTLISAAPQQTAERSSGPTGSAGQCDQQAAAPAARTASVGPAGTAIAPSAASMPAAAPRVATSSAPAPLRASSSTPAVPAAPFSTTAALPRPSVRPAWPGAAAARVSLAHALPANLEASAQQAAHALAIIMAGSPMSAQPELARPAAPANAVGGSAVPGGVGAQPGGSSGAGSRPRMARPVPASGLVQPSVRPPAASSAPARPAMGVPQQIPVMPSSSGTQSAVAPRQSGPAQPHHMPAPAAQGVASRPFPSVMGGPLGAQPASRPIYSHTGLPVSMQQGNAAVVTSGARRPHQAPAAVFPRPLPTAAVSTAQNGGAQLSAASQAMALQLHTAMLEVSRQQAVERQAQQQQGDRAQGRAPGMQPPSYSMSLPGQQPQGALPPHVRATVPGSAAPAASQPQASVPGVRPGAPQSGASMQQQLAIALCRPQQRIIMPGTGAVLAPGNAQAAAPLPHDSQVFMQAVTANIATSQAEVQDTIRKLKAGKEDMVTAMSVAARQLPMYDQALEALQATNEQLSSYGVIMQRLACENADLTAEVRRLHEERNDSDGEQLEELQAEVQRLKNENVRLRIAMAPRGSAAAPRTTPVDRAATAQQQVPIQAARAPPAPAVAQQLPAQRSTGSLASSQQQEQQQKQGTSVQPPARLPDQAAPGGATLAAATPAGGAQQAPVSRPSVGPALGQNGTAESPGVERSASIAASPGAGAAAEAPRLAGQKRKEQASSSMSEGVGPAAKKQAAASVGQHPALEAGATSHAQDGWEPSPVQPIERPAALAATSSAQAQAAGASASMEPAVRMQEPLVPPESVPNRGAAQETQVPAAVPGKADETMNGGSSSPRGKSEKPLARAAGLAVSSLARNGRAPA